MHKFVRVFKVMLASVLMTLMFSCSASSLSGKSFVGTDLIEMVIDGAQHLDQQVRGFGRRGGFGMNFGGNGKGGASNTVNRNNTATNTNTKNNTNATSRRSGFLGFLGGLGMFSWLLLGAGLLGGGFLIYFLAMLLIPLLMGMFASKRQNAADDLPSSQYSSSELFKEPPQDQNQRKF